MSRLAVQSPDLHTHPGPDGGFPWRFSPNAQLLQTIHPFGLARHTFNQHLEDLESKGFTPDNFKKFVNFAINDLLPTLKFVRADLAESLYEEIKKLKILKTTSEMRANVFGLLWAGGDRLPREDEEIEALFNIFVRNELLPRIQKLL